MLDLQMVASPHQPAIPTAAKLNQMPDEDLFRRVEAVISHLGDPARSANDRVAPFITIGFIDRIDYYLNGRADARTHSIWPQTWVPASGNVGGRWVSTPMGPGLRPVVYNLLSSTWVRTRPPAHAPHTPALVPSSTY